MENKNKKAAVFALIVIVLSVISLKINFPDLTFPVINNYTSDPAAPSANGSPYKLYYETLAPVEKQAYNMILDRIYDMPDKILVPDLDEEGLDNVFRAVLYDNPDLFFLGRKCSVTAQLWNDFFSVEYIISKDEYETQKKEIDEVCKKILASMPDGDDWNKELYIHNWIVDHCSYKIEEKEYIYSSVYGALVNNVAACEGYSKAAKLLLDKAGIQSAVISGTASSSRQSGGSHMWNVVNVRDGWYHLDCTWDDPVTDKGSAVRLYTYFNVSDEVIKKNHSDFSIDVGCVSDNANYYSSTGLVYPNYTDADEYTLANKISAQFRQGEKHIQISFINEKSYKKAYKRLIEDYRLSAILSEKRAQDGKRLTEKLEGYYEDKDLYTLTLVFK